MDQVVDRVRQTVVVYGQQRKREREERESLNSTVIWMKAGGNVAPSGEDGFTKGIHSLEVGKVLHQVSTVNCSVVPLKDPVITAQSRVLPAATSPHSQLPFDAPAQPKAPQIMMVPPTLCRHRWDLLFMPVTLEAIRTAQIKDVLISPLLLPCKVQMGKFVAWE
ncbi:hypothetical protein Q8A73_017124 [Channa argus]|nr:hypothetical protein Q8A73_017124 [Channa argus]